MRIVAVHEGRRRKSDKYGRERTVRDLLTVGVLGQEWSRTSLKRARLRHHLGYTQALNAERDERETPSGRGGARPASLTARPSGSVDLKNAGEPGA